MMRQERKAVFLDRDGVINREVIRNDRPYPPGRWEEVEIPEDVPGALEKLKKAGFLLIVVTNQPDVARGTQSRKNVEAIHAGLLGALPLDEIFVCYHDDGDGCSCRKPLPGLFHQAAARFSIHLSSSFMVGDRWRDIEAGHRAGCTTILVDRRYAERGRPASRLSGGTPGRSRQVDPPSPKRRSPFLNALSGLRVKIFADGADRAGMLEMYRNPVISGFTTNPTLLRKAGVSDYQAFALDMVKAIPDRSISFEVFSDEFDEMEIQARKISRWGKNVYVKIPVTDTRGVRSLSLIRKLAGEGIKLNVTAMMTLAQVRDVSLALSGGPSAYVSIFAGRIADTGRDPLPIMAEAVELLRPHPNIELIWASPRELLNIFQADSIGCHIITATHDILKKLPVVGKDLDLFSLETVKMFRDDALKAGYVL